MSASIPFRKILYTTVWSMFICYSNAQVVGGGCDGCELMYIGMPARIHSTDTSAGWYEPGQNS